PYMRSCCSLCRVRVVSIYSLLSTILSIPCFVMFLSFFSVCYSFPRCLPSFPTRRSSDLVTEVRRRQGPPGFDELEGFDEPGWALDRKSTRLNSSHVSISYAVFFLKKKIDLLDDAVRSMYSVGLSVNHDV